MKIELDIPEETISNMVLSFVESRDPVTRGWCSAVKGSAVRVAAALVSGKDFTLEVVEHDEDTGKKTKHKVNRESFVKGLQTMAVKYPHSFRHVLENDTDEPCADILFQCMVFGEEKYA